MRKQIKTKTSHIFFEVVGAVILVAVVVALLMSYFDVLVK
jgi:hypothetical protein